MTDETSEKLAKYAQGHRERRRKECRARGFAHLSDRDLLEILLFYGIPRKDTEKIARALIGDFANLTGVLDASVAELMTENEIGESTAVLLGIAGELSRRYVKERLQPRGQKLNTFRDVVRYLQSGLVAERREQFRALALDSGYRLVEDFQPVYGGATSVAPDVQELCRRVLRVGCQNVVVAHNHPSGNVRPSVADERFTVSLLESFSALGLRLVDHVIVACGSEEYYSFRLNGAEQIRGRFIAADQKFSGVADSEVFQYE